MNNLVVNQTYSNFTLQERFRVEDIDSMYNYFKHDELGTKLIFIENSDEEKLFSITFKTPASDSTGIQHILEHSVLRGSKKYNYGNEEVFTNVIKNSILTFINAMTYPDKTVYPFSTMIESEFFKVMDIYLDSVFFPSLLNNINFFRQEGWRYEKDENENIIYNGVVFNEMKGRLSDPLVLDEEIKTSHLFNDTQYRFNTGGDPNEIPNLNFEKFVEYHQKYYHPSNAIVIVYGNLNIKNVLTKIENDFLVYFDKAKKAEDILLQPSFNEKFITTNFLAQDEKKSSILSISFLTEHINNIKENFALNLLVELLTSQESSLLRKNILDTKLVESFNAYMEEDLQQCFISFIFEGIDENDVPTLIDVFYNSLQQIVELKFNTDYLESVIKKQEYFEYSKKFSTGKGISLTTKILRYVLHDLSPIQSLESSKNFAWIKHEQSKGLFESLVTKHLLQNPSKVTSILKANKDTNPYEILARQLQKINYNHVDFINIQKSIDDFKQYQDNSFQPCKNKILPPKFVKLGSNISDDIKPVVNDGILYFYNHINDSNIENCFLSFDATHIHTNRLPYLRFFEKILLKAKTRNFSQEQTEVFIQKLFGKLEFSVTTGNNHKVDYIAFNVSLSYLSIDKCNALAFFRNMLENIDFTEDIILQIINQEIQAFKNSFAFKGNQIAILRAASKFSSLGILNEKLFGYDYYIFLNRLKLKFIKNPHYEIEVFKAILKNLFNKKVLSIALTSNEPDYKIHEKLPLSNYEIKQYHIPLIASFANEALLLDNLENNFNILATDLSLSGIEYDSKLNVFSNFISYNYLWNQIREKGGAYGAQMSFNRNTNLFSISSYMDPRLKETYNDYYKIIDFLKKSEYTEAEIKGLIAKSLSPLLAPNNQLNFANESLRRYLNGDKPSLKRDTYEDIKNFTQDDMNKYTEIMNTLLTNSVRITLCSTSHFNSNSQFFDKYSLIE